MKFKVRVIQDATLYCDLEVEADNEDEAGQKAVQEALTGYPDWESSEGNWHDENDTWASDIEELE